MFSISGIISTLTYSIKDLVDLNRFKVLIKSFFNFDEFKMYLILYKKIFLVARINVLNGFSNHK